MDSIIPEIIVDIQAVYKNVWTIKDAEKVLGQLRLHRLFDLGFATAKLDKPRKGVTVRTTYAGRYFHQLITNESVLSQT